LEVLVILEDKNHAMVGGVALATFSIGEPIIGNAYEVACFIGKDYRHFFIISRKERRRDGKANTTSSVFTTCVITIMWNRFSNR
jgi:hypothetical protein